MSSIIRSLPRFFAKKRDVVTISGQRAHLMEVTTRDLRPGDVFQHTDEVVTTVEPLENDSEQVRVFIRTDIGLPMAYIRRLSAPALIRRRIDAAHVLPALIGARA